MSESCYEDIKHEEIHRLIESFSKTSYKVKADRKVDPVAERCLKLFAKDYQFSMLNNTSGDLCAHYPSKIVILEYEKTATIHERVESLYDGSRLKEQIKQARFARCRSRFVVPVILFEGKHVCRSATLSSGAEMYSRSGLDFFLTGNEQTSQKLKPAASDSDLQMFDRVRGQDINILKTFNVKYIVDLMVEKKKVKFGMNITSSEKVDKENRYGEFCIASVPYPGCEFFREWRDNAYVGEAMKFDWSQSFVDACLDIPPTELLTQLHIDWHQYKSWDLLQLTKNYLKMLVHILTEGDKGLLVHCISGWDRTPMFVSLLRLSLWADGLIHKSLSATEILYLTLAYDWYLFGHSLSDRLMRGEEIMLFCFYFLPHISSEEFSAKHQTSSKPRKCSVTSETSTNSVSKPAENRFSKDLKKHLTPVSSSGSLRGLDERRRRNSSTSSGGSTGSFTLEPNSHFYLNCEDEDGVAPGSSHSWQVISTTGSLVTTESCSGPSRMTSTTNSCEEAIEDPALPERSERWKRLDMVARIFNNAYHHKVTSKLQPDPGNGITNLLDSFAGKLGFKQK
ncbi:myotubularin-related protein 14-like isoform X2 [Mya arenaria]|uniref:myotubularin-related protein 14-like isoform X2 n=1 Tax=Mya arenaria TaxID=6604 RepID=UPI0022DFDFC4|nr:myotubularin-related protein 14-like isoform X2 [Mya arenaria]